MAVSEEQIKQMFRWVREERLLQDSRQENLEAVWRQEGYKEAAIEYVEEQQEADAAKAKTQQHQVQPVPGEGHVQTSILGTEVDTLAVPAIGDLLDAFISGLSGLGLTNDEVGHVADVAEIAVRASLPAMRPRPSAPRSQHNEEQERALRVRQVEEQIQREYRERGLSNRVELTTRTVNFVNQAVTRVLERYAQTQTCGYGAFDFGNRELNHMMNELREQILALAVANRYSPRG